MLPPGRIASRISQVGLAVYIVLYSAFDAVAGIGGAVLAGYREGLPSAERPTVNGAIWSLMGEADVTAYLAEAATYGWELGVLGAVVALCQDRGWRRGLRIAIPLAPGRRRVRAESLPAVRCCRRRIARDCSLAVLRDISHARSGRCRSRSGRVASLVPEAITQFEHHLCRVRLKPSRSAAVWPRFTRE